MKAIGETILRDVNPTRSMDVLDYGCGTGLVGLFLLPHVRSVTGADNSPGMLEVLNGKIAEERLDNMRAIQLDLEQDPVPTDRFHLVVVSMTMHHVVDLDSVIRAFHQLLLPGGTLCIADLDTESGAFHGPEMADIVHHGFDRQELKRRLREAGFTGARDTTVAKFHKPVAGDREEEFSVFLISGAKEVG